MTHPTNNPSPTTATLLAQAHAARQAGNLFAARIALERVLETEPDNIPAALELGQVLIALKQPTAAMGLFQRCIAARPADPDMRLVLGIALMEQNEPAAAAAVFLKATRLAPQRLSPRLMLAKSLAASGRAKDALSILQQTTEAFSDAPELWAQRGSVERALNDNTAAEFSFRRQHALAPDDFNALNNLGVALRALGRLTEAVTTYRQALVLAPGAAVVHANLGNALDVLGQSAQAEVHLREAARLDPSSVDARYNLAAHLVREEKPDDAIPALRQVVAAEPKRWDAWTNLGVALVAVGDLTQAEACYRTAIRLSPNAPEPHYNLAWLLLLTGQWREGWAEYEWRWQLPHMSALNRSGRAPKWDGTPQPHAIIALHCEQGLGDSIQFVRLAKNVKALCKRVIVQCPPSLVRLFTGLEGIDAVVAASAPLPAHDLSADLMSVPGLLGLTPDTIPHAGAYLAAPSDIPPALKLPVSPRPKIGFVWAGSPDNKIDRRRSCAVTHFARLFDGLEIDVVSLQTGPKAADLAHSGLSNITLDINGNATDWTDTAAVVAQLDLVIGVDTAVMHLAGAMGRQTWILLPSSPDFRWLMARADSPWYSAVRLHRQRVRGDWAGLFDDVRAALTLWLQTHR